MALRGDITVTSGSLSVTSLVSAPLDQNDLSYQTLRIGADGRDRTDDHLIGNQKLYH